MSGWHRKWRLRGRRWAPSDCSSEWRRAGTASTSDRCPCRTTAIALSPACPAPPSRSSFPTLIRSPTSPATSLLPPQTCSRQRIGTGLVQLGFCLAGGCRSRSPPRCFAGRGESTGRTCAPLSSTTSTLALKSMIV